MYMKKRLKKECKNETASEKAYHGRTICEQQRKVCVILIKVIIFILFVITSYTSTPLEAFEPRFALRADLGAFPALILIAPPADRESTLVAPHERLSLLHESDVIST